MVFKLGHPSEQGGNNCHFNTTNHAHSREKAKDSGERPKTGLQWTQSHRRVQQTCWGASGAQGWLRKEDSAASHPEGASAEVKDAQTYFAGLGEQDVRAHKVVGR